MAGRLLADTEHPGRAAIPGLGETGIPRSRWCGHPGSLITGTMGAVVCDKIRETAGSYFKVVDSFNVLRKLNPWIQSAQVNWFRAHARRLAQALDVR